MFAILAVLVASSAASADPFEVVEIEPGAIGLHLDLEDGSIVDRDETEDAIDERHGLAKRSPKILETALFKKTKKLILKKKAIKPILKKKAIKFLVKAKKTKPIWKPKAKKLAIVGIPTAAALSGGVSLPTLPALPPLAELGIIGAVAGGAGGLGATFGPPIARQLSSTFG